MNRSIQAIYEHGILRPLQPLNLPENKIVEIDVRDITDNKEKETNNAEKIKAFDEWMNNLDPNTPALTENKSAAKAFTKNNFCGKYDLAD